MSEDNPHGDCRPDECPCYGTLYCQCMCVLRIDEMFEDVEVEEGSLEDCHLNQKGEKQT